MSKGKKRPQEETRYQKNLRIAVIVISILLVLSLALSAVTSF